MNYFIFLVFWVIFPDIRAFERSDTTVRFRASLTALGSGDPLITSHSPFIQLENIIYNSNTLEAFYDAMRDNVKLDEKQMSLQQAILESILQSQHSDNASLALFFNDYSENVNIDSNVSVNVIEYISPSVWKSLAIERKKSRDVGDNKNRHENRYRIDHHKERTTISDLAGTSVAESESASESKAEAEADMTIMGSHRPNYVPLLRTCLRLCQATYNLRLNVTNNDENEDNSDDKQDDQYHQSLATILLKELKNKTRNDMAAIIIEGTTLSRLGGLTERVQAVLDTVDQLKLTSYSSSSSSSSKEEESMPTEKNGTVNEESSEIPTDIERLDDVLAKIENFIQTNAGTQAKRVQNIFKKVANMRAKAYQNGLECALLTASAAMGYNQSEFYSHMYTNTYGITDFIDMNENNTNSKKVLIEPLLSDRGCGLFAYDRVNRVAVIAFRGTKEPLDVATDVTFVRRSLHAYDYRGTRDVDYDIKASDLSYDIGSRTRTRTSEGKLIGRVHAGFLSAFQSLSQQVENHLQTLPHGTRVVFAGHSLGGALATIASARYSDYVMSNISNGERPLLVSIGAPAAGDRDFVEYINNYVAPNGGLRVYNEGDPVPWLSIPVGYRHAGIPLRTPMSNDMIELFSSINSDPDLGGILPLVASHILYRLGDILHIFPVMGKNVSRRHNSNSNSRI
jgi:hypothetical protein